MGVVTDGNKMKVNNASVVTGGPDVVCVTE